MTPCQYYYVIYPLHTIRSSWRYEKESWGKTSTPCVKKKIINQEISGPYLTLDVAITRKWGKQQVFYWVTMHWYLLSLWVSICKTCPAVNKGLETTKPYLCITYSWNVQEISLRKVRKRFHWRERYTFQTMYRLFVAVLWKSEQSLGICAIWYLTVFASYLIVEHWAAILSPEKFL